MVPCTGRVFDHSQNAVIILVILDIEKHGLRPHLVPFTCSKEFWDVEPPEVRPTVVHESFWLMFSIHHSQLCKQPNVGPFQTESLLQEFHQFLNEPEPFVTANNVLNMVRVYNDLQPRYGRQLELPALHTRHVDLLPSLGGVCLFGRLQCFCEPPQFYKAAGQFCVIVDAGK